MLLTTNNVSSTAIVDPSSRCHNLTMDRLTKHLCDKKITNPEGSSSTRDVRVRSIASANYHVDVKVTSIRRV